MRERKMMLCGALLLCAAARAEAPYPPSAFIEKIEWHWETRVTAAPGSDLWPVTWGPDGHLYTAFGDGGGFGGTDSEGRVAMGFARLEGPPEKFHGVNINGGMKPEHPATFPKKGKTNALAFVDGVLYAKANLQDGVWPDVNHALVWSKDFGATWTQEKWFFPKGAGNFRPEKFLNFGMDYSGVPGALGNYVYLYGAKMAADRQHETGIFLVRVLRNKLREREAYEFFQRMDERGTPLWTADFAAAQPVFTDAHGTRVAGAVYNPGLKRFLLTAFHVGPGQLGVFDSEHPWGPWTTVMYAEDWGKMGVAGEGLSCEFPPKWISADGLAMWSVFSAYGDGAKVGIVAHDRFNLVKATLKAK